MSPKDWRRVEELFAEVVELPPAERAARLAAAEDELRAEVETLLRHDQAAGAALEAAVGVAAANLPAEVIEGSGRVTPGLRIGSFRLLRELGRGGMGAVWLAERADGTFSQQVAIKLIRPGRESGQLVARFQEERRILAGLVHPGIARLLDAGTTAAGRPYFVLEYVSGRPLTEYAAELPIRRKLELFVAVALAVAFAHRNLVVHRDLKPGNVLVDAGGAPKLLDFGIAKLIDPQADATQTVAGWLAFSPEYASPEQVMGDRITTATDVYALGAVLYELLTGRKAQPIEVPTPAAILRAACESEPPRPSLAAPQLARELAGDLDAIVMKALRKAPEARYASAAELADDLRRYLAAEPVRARQGKLVYRARLFARRNRVAVAAGLIVALSVVGGLLAAIWQERARSHEAELARRRFDQVRGLATRFLFDFEKAIAKLPGSTEARRMVIASAVEHLDGLAADAAGDAGLQLELAQAYFRLGRLQGSSDSANLGENDAALKSFHKSRDLAQALVAQEPARADYLEALAMAHLDTAILLLSGARRGEGRAEVLAGLAVGRPLARASGALAHRRLVASLLLRLSDVSREDGQLQEARAALEEALQFQSRDPATTLARLGLVNRESGDLEAARRSFEEALASLAASATPPGNTPCFLAADLARTLLAADWPSLGRGAEAGAAVERAIACGEERVASDARDVSKHFALLEALKTAGAIYAATDPRRGLAILERAAAELAAASALAPQAFDLAVEGGLIALARAKAHLELGEAARARHLLEEARPALAAAVGREVADVRSADALWQLDLRLGVALAAEGRGAAAAEAFRRALAQGRQAAAAPAPKPIARFLVATAAEGLARLAVRGDGAVAPAEARALAAEAAGLWQAWKEDHLTAAFADGKLADNAALQAALAAKETA